MKIEGVFSLIKLDVASHMLAQITNTLKHIVGGTEVSIQCGADVGQEMGLLNNVP